MTSDRNAGHIVAMGGGGFSMEPDNPLLEHFLVEEQKMSAKQRQELIRVLKESLKGGEK